jgi:hypothetical protein
MNVAVELPESDYQRLQKAAAAEGVTPAAWIAARLPAHVEVQTCSNGKPARTMADLFADRVGLVASDRSQSSAEIVDGAKPATMAERLAGRIGTLSGSGGRPSSDDVARSFAEFLEAKQRQGRL